MRGEIVKSGKIQLDDIIMSLHGTESGVLAIANHYEARPTKPGQRRPKDKIRSHLLKMEGLTQVSKRGFTNHIVGVAEDSHGTQYIALHEVDSGILDSIQVVSSGGSARLYNLDHLILNKQQVESVMGITIVDDSLVIAVETRYTGPIPDYKVHSRLHKLSATSVRKIDLFERTDINDGLIINAITPYQNGILLAFGEKGNGKLTYVNEHDHVEWEHSLQDGAYAIATDTAQNIYVGVNRPSQDPMKWKGTMHVLNQDKTEIGQEDFNEGILALASSKRGNLYVATTNDFRENKSHLHMYSKK